MLPRGFDLDRLFGAWVDWGFVAQNNKYANNYDYHKAVWLLNQEPSENGFLLVKEDERWMSPVGTLFTNGIIDLSAVAEKAASASSAQLQCVSTHIQEADFATKVPLVALGQTQNPAPWDYADGVDTLNFIGTIFVTNCARNNHVKIEKENGSECAMDVGPGPRGRIGRMFHRH